MAFCPYKRAQQHKLLPRYYARDAAAYPGQAGGDRQEYDLHSLDDALMVCDGALCRMWAVWSISNVQYGPGGTPVITTKKVTGCGLINPAADPVNQ